MNCANYIVNVVFAYKDVQCYVVKYIVIKFVFFVLYLCCLFTYCFRRCTPYL